MIVYFIEITHKFSDRALCVERSPCPAGTFLAGLSVSPVTLRTRGLTAPHRGTAHWLTGPSHSRLLSPRHSQDPRPPISPRLSPEPRPSFSLSLSLLLTPGVSELDQPLELIFVERVQTGTVDGGRVEFVADLTVVPQVAGHTAGGGAACRSSDRPLTHQHGHHQDHQHGLALYCQQAHRTLSV